MLEDPLRFILQKILTKFAGGAKIYLKREDLLHGGAHKINNTLGQALLAKRMKKKRIIAETGGWSAWCCNCDGVFLFGFTIRSLHGIQRYSQTAAKCVFRMDLLGCKVYPVKSGSQNTERRN